MSALRHSLHRRFPGNVRARSAALLGVLGLASLLAASPAQAQTLRIGLAEDPDLLDPTRARTFVGRIVFSALCDKLIDIDEQLAYQLWEGSSKKAVRPTCSIHRDIPTPRDCWTAFPSSF